MTTIHRTIDIDAPMASVWDKISDTQNISNLIGFLANSEQTGDTRVCTLTGGGELKEKIVSVDQDLQRVMYSITDSPLNMDFHAASMQLRQNGDKTRLEWTVDLLPVSASEQMSPMLDGACQDMKITLAA